MSKKQEFERIISKLIALGEDREEFRFWVEFFDHMTHEEQDALITNVQNELTQLERLYKK